MRSLVAGGASTIVLALATTAAAQTAPPAPTDTSAPPPSPWASPSALPPPPWPTQSFAKEDTSEVGGYRSLFGSRVVTPTERKDPSLAAAGIGVTLFGVTAVAAGIILAVGGSAGGEDACISTSTANMSEVNCSTPPASTGMEGAGAVAIGAGVVALVVGIPMIVVGARSVPAEVEARAAPRVFATRNGLAISF